MKCAFSGWLLCFKTDKNLNECCFLVRYNAEHVFITQVVYIFKGRM